MVDSTRSWDYLVSKRNQDSNEETRQDHSDTGGLQSGDYGIRNPAYESDEQTESMELKATGNLDNDDEPWEMDFDEVELRDEDEEEYSWIASNIPILTSERHIDSLDPDGDTDLVQADSVDGEADINPDQNDTTYPTRENEIKKPSALALPVATNLYDADSNDLSKLPKSPKDVLDQGKPPKNATERNWIAEHIPLPPGTNDQNTKTVDGLEVNDIKLLDRPPILSGRKPALEDQKTYVSIPPQPNTAFGKVEFVGYSFKTPPYARVAMKTEPDKVVHMMHAIWKMKLPTLLLSIYGNVIPSKSLLCAAKRIGAWITSTALSRELLLPDDKTMKLTEECEDCPNVGIAVWRRVHNKAELINTKATGSFPATYRRPTDSCSDYLHLDPRHSQFLLLDGATTPSDNFTDRLEMENAIKKSLSIPHIVILDDPANLLDIMDAAIKKNSHIILFKGRSKAGEAVVKLLRLQKDIKIKYGRKTIRSQPSVSDSRIREVLMQLLGARSIDKKVVILKTCLRKHRMITSVPGTMHDYSGSLSDLLLKSLIKAKTGSSEERMWSHPLSYVASSSDDEDDDEIMYQELVPWKLGNTKHIVLRAILEDDVACVENVLDEGGSIKSFTTMQLAYLYNKIPEASILQKLLTERNDQATVTTLYDVGMVVKDLLGDKFYSRYIEEGYKHMNVQEMLTFMKSRYKFAKEIEDKTTALKDLDGLDIFIWSILLNRQELAKLFWKRGKAHLAWALLAKYLLSALEQNSRDAETSAKLAKSAEEFQDMAMGIVHEMHTSNPKRTQDILVNKMDELEGTSVVIIATELQNRKFVSHIACQSLYQKIFYGSLRQHNSFLKVIICIFLPMLIPWLINFRDHKTHISKKKKVPTATLR